MRAFGSVGSGRDARTKGGSSGSGRGRASAFGAGGGKGSAAGRAAGLGDARIEYDGHSGGAAGGGLG
ncbi:MAG: hypothetical protein M3Y43_09470, partial [Pseudomonadota bacterium]|nr:hypothetical protein [Pseudomonadota bacterium]